MLLHDLHEFRPSARFDIEFATDVLDVIDQFLGGSIAVNPGQRGVGAQIMPVRSRLKNAFDDMLENAAIFPFSLMQCRFRVLALDVIPDGAAEQLGLSWLFTRYS